MEIALAVMIILLFIICNICFALCVFCGLAHEKMGSPKEITRDYFFLAGMNAIGLIGMFSINLWANLIGAALCFWGLINFRKMYLKNYPALKAYLVRKSEEKRKGDR